MADAHSSQPPQDDAGTSANPQDKSQYIRTYAKDVARLTDQPLPVTPKPAAPEPSGGVALPEVDASPVNRPDGVAKEFSQEHLTLSKEDSAGIFAQTPAAPVAAASESNSPASAPPPPPPAPAPIEPAVDAEREAVLERLRQKVADASKAAAAATPPQPQPLPAPQVSAPVPPVPPSPPPPPPAQAYTPPPAPPGIVPLAKTGEPSPLHTYTSDFSEKIDRDRASTFTVLAAEQDRGSRASASPAKRRTLLPTVLAVLLIVLGTGGLYAAYQFAYTGNEAPESLGVPSLILADEKMELRGPDYKQALADAAAQPLVEGNILVTYVTVASTTPLGLANAPQPGGELIRRLELAAPDILMRNVDLASTVGVVSAGGQTQPFFILRVNSFERTFAGMLGWENRILADLDPLYPPYLELPAPAQVATTTGTTTDPVPPPAPATLSPNGFVDDVVANRDVRALRDSLGRTLILYGYSDKQTLIIARDEAAFTTLVARLTATRSQ